MRCLGPNTKAVKPITPVMMREQTDCLTCVTAMLLGITYEDVKSAFGGNIDPSKGQDEASRFQESARLQEAFLTLLGEHNCGILQLVIMPPIIRGRRYWVSVHIDDASRCAAYSCTIKLAYDFVQRLCTE